MPLRALRLKAERIDDITGELTRMLEPQTSDRAYLFDLLNVHCISSSTVTREAGCQDPELRTVMVQNASSVQKFSSLSDQSTGRPASHKTWSQPEMTGHFWNRRSVRYAEKVAMSVSSAGYGSFTAGESESTTLHIDVASNFGEALAESERVAAGLGCARTSPFPGLCHWQ
jgi:hypothetical protein